ncbi:hypothetical protein [Xanthomonas fragariae]|nr:hypothetical protein [Xanthomonas fragariae]UKR53847.1 hypothetical protein K4A87_08470 [Xanthomonas fragariae]
MRMRKLLRASASWSNCTQIASRLSASESHMLDHHTAGFETRFKQST